jgi:hypothetical protein
MIGDAASSQKMQAQFREIILGDRQMVGLSAQFNWTIN